jgi:flagellar protein FliL
MASKDSAKDAEALADGEESAPAKKGFLSLKMIIVAGVALAVLGGGGLGAMKFLGGDDKPVAAAVAKPAVFFDVPEVLVNLSSTAGDRTHYLKVKIVLELPDQTVQPQIQAAMPRVIDTFQTYLRELRPTDLDGSAGLYRLKEELTKRVNLSIAPNKINAVLFKEIVVQ